MKKIVSIAIALISITIFAGCIPKEVARFYESESDETVWMTEDEKICLVNDSREVGISSYIINNGNKVLTCWTSSYRDIYLILNEAIYDDNADGRRFGIENEIEIELDEEGNEWAYYPTIEMWDLIKCNDRKCVFKVKANTTYFNEGDVITLYRVENPDKNYFMRDYMTFVKNRLDNIETNETEETLTFDINDMRDVGGDITATYTAMNNNGYDITLEDVVKSFKKIGALISSDGYVGPNPYNIGYALSLNEIEYSLINEYPNDLEEGQYIISYWDKEKNLRASHTIALSVDGEGNVIGYNVTEDNTDEYDFGEHNDFENIVNAEGYGFIVGYKLK